MAVVLVNEPGEQSLRDEIRRLEQALQGAGQGVWDHDLVTGTARYSDVWRAMRGYGPDDDVDALAGRWIDRIHPEDRQRIEEATARQDVGELRYNAFEYRERHRDGHWIWILSRGRPTAWTADGQVARTLGTDTDITTLKETKLALAQEKERLQVTLRSVGEGLICLDLGGAITSFNTPASSLTGWRPEEAIGRSVWEVLDLRSAEDEPLCRSMVAKAIELDDGSTLTQEAEIARRDGSRRRALLTISPVMIRGTLASLVSVIRDTTEEHDYKARLHHAATHDALTGLPNRTVFEAAIEGAWQSARKDGRHHALCMLDLDRFKLINDTAGHVAGDRVLKAVATTLSECAGEGSVVARLGGDEFALLLTDATDEIAFEICDRITAAIGALSFQFGERLFSVGVSIGTKCITGREETIAAVMALADQACYAAKAAGRGRWVSADRQMAGTGMQMPAIVTDPAGDRIASNFARAAQLALITISTEGRIEFVNAAALKLFGYEEREMLGQSISVIIPARMRGAHVAGLAKVAAGERPNLGGKTVEVTALKRDGTEFPIEITLSIWRDNGQLFAGAVIKDISERRERDNKLLRLASQDTLTGLHNRHRFIDILKAEIAEARPTTLIMLCLDGFKEINDVHGHGLGDAVLQAVGVRLPYMLPAGAEIARLGGDEFGVIMPGIGDPLDASRFVSAIMEAFAKPFDIGGHLLDLGASIGYSIYPAHGGDDEELIASADFALFRARAAGKRSCRMFDPTMRSDVAARRALRDELAIALRNRELVMHYQPQVHLANDKVFGCEALIRWQHPQRGLLLPGAFLPALEQSSLELEIGWWTLDEVCRQLARFNAAGHRIKMGVNLFPAQMRSPSLCDMVAEAIRRHGIEPQDLELEVTESVALHDNDKSLDTLHALRAMGVGIAFDDFGTGYASLSSLQRYPLTTLKIDKGFVRDVLTSPQDAAITRALIAMSGELGLQTIAEGIETSEQEAVLRSFGCPAGQGFRFGKAMSGPEFARMLSGDENRSFSQLG